MNFGCHWTFCIWTPSKISRLVGERVGRVGEITGVNWTAFLQWKRKKKSQTEPTWWRSENETLLNKHCSNSVQECFCFLWLHEKKNKEPNWRRLPTYPWLASWLMADILTCNKCCHLYQWEALSCWTLILMCQMEPFPSPLDLMWRDFQTKCRRSSCLVRLAIWKNLIGLLRM